jgi:hypothetical protein
MKKEVQMNIDQSTLIGIAVISSITLIGVIVLIRNTDTKIDFNLGKNLGSLTIEGKQSPRKTNDCLPSGESSHRLNCNNH